MRPCLITFLFVFGSSACTPEPNEHSQLKADGSRIRARYHAMDSLFAVDRMSDIADVYSDTADIVSVGRVIHGKEDIRAYWEMLQGSGVSWDHGIEGLEIRGDRAIQSGTSELHYRSGDDTLVSFVRYTLIWAKDSTGQWWIDRDHYTPMPRVVVE